ncbi:MAG: VWA domain-containing protein, partial [Desertimonas sp.]
MIDALVGFVALLRAHGVGVGSDRTVLAARAAGYVDLGDRAALRRALRLVLVVHRSDEARFDELFERWFSDAPLAEAAAAILDDAGHVGEEPAPPAVEIRAEKAPDAYVDDPAEQVGLAADGDDDDRRGVRAEGAADAEAGERTARYDTEATIGHPDELASGGPAERTAAEPGRATIEIELDDVVDPGDVVAELRRLLDDAHRRRLELLAAPPAAASPSLRPSALLANPFDAEEQRALDGAVRALWRQLTGAPSWRRRPSPGGVLDLRRTMRASLSLGGIPGVLRYRAPATNRPDLLVLVDTSVSMRPYVRLMLHLAHALRRRPGRIRVLAFIDECVEVTDVIRHADLAVALGGLLDDAPGGPLDPARPSDYGAALGSLWHR